MNRFFPELVTMLDERRDGSFVADGEIVLVQPGSLSFDTLQLRSHRGENVARPDFNHSPTLANAHACRRQTGS